MAYVGPNEGPGADGAPGGTGPSARGGSSGGSSSAKAGAVSSLASAAAAALSGGKAAGSTASAYHDGWGTYTGGGSGGGGSSSPKSKVDAETLLGEQAYFTENGNPYTQLAAGAPSAYKLPELEGPNPERIDHVDTETLKGMLQQIVDLQKEQSQKSIDYSVEQGTNELNRAMEDAAKSYDTQRDQIAKEEAKALDNQALYAEARGDRGGIGEAQYASIQNTAAQNRRAVNDAQVKLGTDTARQIADLRAKGEFEKADQVLSITQSYLSNLKDLEQWALGTNLSVDEFNSQLQQWVDEYNMKKQQYLSDLELSAAQLTGMFSDGTRTMAAQQQLIQSLANSGNALLQAGVMPSRQQLEAMGLTEQQAKAYFNAMGIKY